MDKKIQDAIEALDLAAASWRDVARAAEALMEAVGTIPLPPEPTNDAPNRPVEEP